MDQPACFNCRFFVPESSAHNDLTQAQWDDGLEGECRRHTPTLGIMLTDRHGDEFRHYGEWPKVMAGDWCGCFESKVATVHTG